MGSLRPEDLEVLVVDQNGDDRLVPVLAPYVSRFALVHLRAPSLGQSNAKNIGLKKATGRYVGFPDDDCYYAPDTLEKTLRAFQGTGDRCALFGRAQDTETGKFLLEYPSRPRSIVSPSDMTGVFLGIQIAQFFTLEMARQVGDFDVDLCSGGRWGSGEEADYVLRFLKNGGRIEYRPEILVHHPLVVPDSMTIEKVRRYATGFGALCRKQGLPSFLAFKAAKQMIGALVFLLTGRWKRAVTAWNVGLFRVRGYLEYGRHVGAKG
jgi:glycosyltransferase involved in cell wall biosynthesis